nr:hypothetical protein [Tanacetum cinerariifolium]
MQHTVDGKAWKEFDTKYSDFAAEPRNVRLGLATDGFNPFGNLSQSYSMWPQYLGPDVAKPLIELSLFFKQICYQTLIVDDMLKSQSKVIDILCNLELIYPPAFFDIMIHLVIHLPLEAIFGGPIRPRWMKFNRLDRNVDCPPPTCQLQVFKSLCKSIGLRLVIRIDHQELKKVIWYVLHNNPEIDTYRAKFKMYVF